MRDAVIVSAVRTPIGGFQGALSSVPAVDLGARVIAEALRRAGVDPESVEEVLMGNVLSAGLGQNPARQAALRGGLPETVPATTINKVCGSGLKTVALAAQAVHAALARAGLEVGDVDLAELNEAFAAQSLAVCRELGLDPERTNVNGGAIALGHPIGASGTRVLTTLLHEMARREARVGLASLCIGGGQGIAMVVEREGGA